MLHHFNDIYEMAKELISRRIKKTGINDEKQTHNVNAGICCAHGQFHRRGKNAGVLL
ncbi:hypothetical protein EcWSU1_02149 [Enterobacter ludwigii]|uniref:Uncharacterized protein n=1 Tax=Enterobacter ludwigii TaxID=299767 RepID=G8LPD1_9ENTR|nr:hypothetical protein EcWSU1_02149 [Enterobacter ludwigii]